MPRDAEAWLAERGVRRDPIRVQPQPADGAQPAGSATPGQRQPPEPTAEPSEPTAQSAEPTAPAAGTDTQGGPELSVRDATRLLDQATADAELRRAEAEAVPDPSTKRLEDDVAEAVAFLRRSTSVAPQSEGRLRDKLSERGFAPPVVEQALERARRERLVDDVAMVAALVEERQRKGHAPAKIRRDLRERGFDDATIDVALRNADDQDLEAAAFAVARDKAERSRGLPPEAAYRRVAAHVARRGYPEGLARKVAREAVFTSRDDQRIAGH